MPQIDLRRTARAFDDYQLEIPRKIAVATDYLRPCLSAISLIVIHTHLKSRAAPNDYLANQVRLRFQQHGIHVDARLESGRIGLHGLRATDLAATGADGCVVRHVLRFERRYANPRARTPCTAP